MILKNNLDKAYNNNIEGFRQMIKARLYQNRCSHYDYNELLNEAYLFCLEQTKPHMTETDYIKITKNYINNQSKWSSGSGQPKETSKNFKLKHKIGGFDNTNEVDIIDEQTDERIDFVLWVEAKLDRPEKTLFKLHFIDGLTHRKIAELIRTNGIKICDTSVYLEIKKLREKLKNYSTKWSKL